MIGINSGSCKTDKLQGQECYEYENEGQFFHLIPSFHSDMIATTLLFIRAGVGAFTSKKSCKKV